MLVSAISMFRSIAMQHDVALAMMQTHDNTMSMLNASPNRDTSFYALHQQDVNNSLSLAKNSLKYQMASVWRKSCEARLKKEAQQNRLDYKA